MFPRGDDNINGNDPKCPYVYSLSNGFPHSHHPYGDQVARPDGPVLMQDIHLIESISHFDRERVPERVVHAKGGGCRFVFELTDSLSDITYAFPYQKKGYKCPGVVRFSTVGGESGSPDTARDPRGASFKFYTERGIHDWVFNNTPVFFLRDGGKFPYFIHVQKRDPKTHLNAGVDSTHFWDYMTQNPESIHQITYMFGPRGIPAHWPEMSAYSGHAFKMINEKGEMHYVQIHVKSDKGFTTLTDIEGSNLSGKNPDYNQTKLYRQLDGTGPRPVLNCYIQVMTPKQAEEFRYSVNDITKVWPHKDFPLRKFATITLTENVENYFEEIEQIAFSPTNTCIPGIEPSFDNVLQVRLFSYPDTQRYRLGTNYNHLPVNRPTNKNLITGAKCPYASGNFQSDGLGSIYNQGSNPNFISSKPGAHMLYKDLFSDKLSSKFKGVVMNSDVDKAFAEQEKLRENHEKIINAKISHYSYVSGISPLDFEQPRMLYNDVFTDDVKEQFINNVVVHAAKIQFPHVKTRVTQYFGLLNPDLGKAIAEGLGIEWKPVDLETYAKEIQVSAAD